MTNPIMTARILPCSDDALMPSVQQAAACLKSGGLVAMPTETVYGLGADALNPEALARLYHVKGRPSRHPVIVHLASQDQLDDWAENITPAARLLAAAFWPGPLTLILKRKPHVPDAVTGGQDTVGLRVPSHPVALALLQVFGGGIAAPSANRFGRISPTTARHVQEDLGTAIDLILDGGPCAVGVESTIVLVTETGAQILRPGMITADEISEVLGPTVPLRKSADDPKPIRAPGVLPSHYAPQTPLTLVESPQLPETVRQCQLEGLAVGVLARQSEPSGFLESPLSTVWLPWADEPEAAARQLYGALRQLDAMTLDRILVEAVPDAEIWRAVRDRLERAAYRAS